MIDPRMKMYLAEKQEACNVAWLKFIANINPNMINVEAFDVMRDLFKHAYLQAYSAGVDKGIEIAVCPTCGED